MSDQLPLQQNLLPEGISVFRIKTNGLFTGVQYSHQGQKFFSLLNPQSKLFTQSVDEFQPFCFYQNYILQASGKTLILSDPFFIVRRFFCELDVAAKIPYLSTTGRKLMKVILHAGPIRDIEIDSDTIAVAYEHYVSWYHLSDIYYEKQEPLRSKEFASISINGLISLSVDLALYYPTVTSVTKERRVTAVTNIPEPSFPLWNAVDNAVTMQYVHPPKLIHPPARSWRRLLILHDDHKEASLYDTRVGKVIAEFPIKPDERFTFFFFPHERYNPWHRWKMFKGEYSEEYDLNTGIWTQGYTNVEGVFEERVGIYDLMRDVVNSEGVFQRGSGTTLGAGPLERIIVIPSNLNLLNHGWLLFYVKAVDASGIPVPFVKINITVDPSEEGKNQEAHKYFDPVYGGYGTDEGLTDLDGVTWVILRTVAGDFPEQLQGRWSFTIEAKHSAPPSLDTAIEFHGYIPIDNERERIKRVLRNTDQTDFINTHRHYLLNL